MEDIMFVRKIHNSEKGFAPDSLSYKEKLVNTINLLLCHLKQEDLRSAVVALKIVIERLELEDVCHIWVDTETDSYYKIRLFYTGTEENNA